MLMPKRVKYRRPHIIKYEGKSKAGTEIAFGDYGLQAVTGAWVTNRQIEAARITLARHTKRAGKIWIRIFPHLAKTKKPLEVRMGSGKGSPSEWVAVVRPGCVMFEMGEIGGEIAKKALHLASYKLPLRSKVISKEKCGE